MSGEKQKVSPLTEPALPSFNFQFLILNLIRMFSDELEKISWEETTKAIYSKTDADVRRALGKKEHLDVNDFMALISPAATPYLEVMARLSQKYTMERFGKTISMFYRST